MLELCGRFLVVDLARQPSQRAQCDCVSTFRFTCQTARAYVRLCASPRHHRRRRDSSAPEVARRGAPPSFPSSLQRGSGAPVQALRHVGTSEKAPTCRVTGRRALRRSTVASLGSGPLFRARADEHNLAPIQTALAPPFSPSTSSP